jgi:hypothetical protein
MIVSRELRGARNPGPKAAAAVGETGTHRSGLEVVAAVAGGRDSEADGD